MLLSREQTMAAVNDTAIKWRWYDGDVSPVPEWLVETRIHWNVGYSNPPYVRVITNCDIDEWGGKVWKKKGSFYRAYHPDGRLTQHYHDGPVTRDDDGIWHSTENRGYGGAPYSLVMEAGSKVVLHGPWHTSPPAGYDEISHRNQSSKYRVYRGGPMVSFSLYAAVVSICEPAVRLAIVDRGWATMLEPVHESWDVPKSAR